jgi:hypothetical protein
MAYLRKEKEIAEMDYPLDTVWEDIIKAISSQEWIVLEKNDAAHQVKTKTKASFMAYASTFTIDAAVSGEKTTRVTLSAETPVTTITGIVDFGKTRERIDSFFLALIKQLKANAAPEKKDEQ